MLEELKRTLCQANRSLHESDLVLDEAAGASGLDRAADAVIVKPGNLPCQSLRPKDLLVVSLTRGELLEGSGEPGPGLDTHLALYRSLAGIAAIVHSQGRFTTAWAQACKPIPPYGAVHARRFLGTIPCTRELTANEMRARANALVGKRIVQCFDRLDAMAVPAALAARRGGYAWGATVDDALTNALSLELVARLAAESIRIDPYPKPISADLLAMYRRPPTGDRP